MDNLDYDYSKFSCGHFSFFDPDYCPLLACYFCEHDLNKDDPRMMLVDSRTCDPFLTIASEPSPKPYHFTQDHNYFLQNVQPPPIEKKDCLDNKTSSVFDIFNNDILNNDILNNDILNADIPPKDEPHVDVWGLESFSKEPTMPYPRTSKRASAEAADRRRREQDDRIHKAVNAAFKFDKARKVRQCKSIKPKNSVETTPSQSDIEDGVIQPLGQTCVKRDKNTKATRVGKTKKAKSEHSKSERQRRGELRQHFGQLRELVPDTYLRGEKTSSQISKQKILNGAKTYIQKISVMKRKYKFLYTENGQNKEQWQQKSDLFKKLRQNDTPALLKFIKKRK